MAFTWSRGFVPSGPGIHLGVDMAAPLGTPAYIIHGGRVVYAGDTRTDPSPPWWSYWQGQRGAGGIALAVDVGGGRLEHYAHASALYVTVGQMVVAGQRYGSVGATGRAFGSHVHYAIVDGRTWRDPLAGTTRAALLAAIAGRGPGGAILVSAPGEGQGAPLTFWGVVTFPRGHILAAADVQPIIDKLTAAGIIGGDLASQYIAQQGVRGLLNSLVGRQWDDQLARDIQRGLAIAAPEVAAALPGNLTNPFDGLAAGIGQILTGAAWLIAILVLLILGLYVTVTGGSSSNA